MRYNTRPSGRDRKLSVAEEPKPLGVAATLRRNLEAAECVLLKGIGIGVGMRTPRGSKVAGPHLAKGDGRCLVGRLYLPVHDALQLQIGQVRTRPVIAPPVHSGQGDFGKLSVVASSDADTASTVPRMI